MLDRTKNPPDLPDASADEGSRLAPELPAAVDKPAPPVSRRRRLRLPLMLGGVALVALGAGYGWLSGGRYVSTDDAYIRAAKLMVSTDVSGLVSEVAVHEGQTVKAGDELFRIDPRQYEIALRNAQANLDEVKLDLEGRKLDYQRMMSDIAAAEATLNNDQATIDRYNVLVKDPAALSRASYDQARFTLDADKAKLESLKQQAAVQLAKLGGDPGFDVETHPLYLQSKASLDEARRQLDHTTIRAPFAGTVTEVDSLQPGQYLVAQTAALTNQGAVGLISDDKVWIDANVKETDLTYVKPGDEVSVTVDAYPNHDWKGTVGTIAPASGAEFSILPAQNASGNWVKVVQRVPVRVLVERRDSDPPLRAGMSAVVDIDTGHSRKLTDIL
ncbi:HlyD family secretion protein [Ancylobacter sp. G4_0304]|uniref:HlyD family secretion protein n=1 Tax=Ancylobacter sp. G4_0304 TaxID=3114289 RepID=UPI0039C5E058